MLLLVVFPVVALMLLTGGNFDFSASTNLILIGVLGAVIVFSLLTSGMAETGSRPFRVAVIALAAGVALGVLATLLSLLPVAERFASLRSRGVVPGSASAAVRCRSDRWRSGSPVRWRSSCRSSR